MVAKRRSPLDEKGPNGETHGKTRSLRDIYTSLDLNNAKELSKQPVREFGCNRQSARASATSKRTAGQPPELPAAKRQRKDDGRQDAATFVANDTHSNKTQPCPSNNIPPPSGPSQPPLPSACEGDAGPGPSATQPHQQATQQLLPRLTAHRRVSQQSAAAPPPPLEPDLGQLTELADAAAIQASNDQLARVLLDNSNLRAQLAEVAGLSAQLQQEAQRREEAVARAAELQRRLGEAVESLEQAEALVEQLQQQLQTERADLAHLVEGIANMMAGVVQRRAANP